MECGLVLLLETVIVDVTVTVAMAVLVVHMFSSVFIYFLIQHPTSSSFHMGIIISKTVDHMKRVSRYFGTGFTTILMNISCIRILYRENTSLSL